MTPTESVVIKFPLTLDNLLTSLCQTASYIAKPLAELLGIISVLYT